MTNDQNDIIIKLPFVPRKKEMKQIVESIKSEYLTRENQNAKNEESQSEDVVNHPSHYETGKFECIDVMVEALGVDAVRDFCICNAFKYIYRHKRKNGDEDVKKAIWYLNKYISLSEVKENEK